MRRIINLSAITFGLFHQILFTTATFIDIATRTAVSGYICNDLIVWRQKVQEVANNANIMLKDSKTCGKFPALLEDSKLFNVKYQNLFVVPIRNFDSIGRGGSSGLDRVVIDTLGNFISVVALLRKEVNPSLPTYKKCRPFQTYSNYNPNSDPENAIQMAGYACGTNFLDVTVQESMKRQCDKFVDIYVRSRKLSRIPVKKKVVYSKDKVSFTHSIRRDYDDSYTKKPVTYRVEFTWQCSLIQIIRTVDNDSPEKPCRTLYTTALPATLTDDPSLSEHGKNMEQDSADFVCDDYSFRIESIQNYILEYLSLEKNVWGSISDNILVRVSPDFTLFNIRLSERQSAARRIHPQFALGFDREKNFTGLYHAIIRSDFRGAYKACDNFKYLEQGLQNLWAKEGP